jgi:hypothetical protein
MVGGHGVIVGRVVGEIGAGHDERLASLDGLGKGLAEANAQIRIRGADDGEEDLHAREGHLHERHLHLHGVLPGVNGRLISEVRVHGGEPRGALPVALGQTQRRAIAGTRVDRNAAEAGGRVIGAEDDDQVVFMLHRLPVGVGGDLPREDVAGMGGHQRHRPGAPGRESVLQIGANGSFQVGGVGGIEAPGHGRGADTDIRDAIGRCGSGFRWPRKGGIGCQERKEQSSDRGH